MGNSQTSSSIEAKNFAGDPNCPICKGVGYVRRDVPVGDPDFGRLQVCICNVEAERTASRQRLFRLSNLDALQHMTFESFNPNGNFGLREDQVRTLQVALSLSMSYAKTLKGWLVLVGGYGCGKTHLAAAVANYAVHLGVPTLFQTVPDLLDWMRFSYQNPESTFEARFDEIRNIHLLILDDLGTQNATSWAQEKLFQVVNYRYINHLPTVFTSNVDLNEIEGRVRSRIEDKNLSTIAKISAPDYRTLSGEDTSQPQISSLSIHARQTFGSFSLREQEGISPEYKDNIINGFRLAQSFAEKPQGWLIFTGDFGCGKTHLAAAIGNYCAAQGEEPIFMVVPDLLDHLRATFSPSSTVSYDNLFDRVRSASLLILDDLSTQSATPWAREKLYQILNYRYNAEIPTVITMSDRLEEIDPRIQSRFLDTRLCRVFAITVPAYHPAPMTTSKKGRQTRLSK